MFLMNLTTFRAMAAMNVIRLSTSLEALLRNIQPLHETNGLSRM
jgi:hypothetical protein